MMAFGVRQPIGVESNGLLNKTVGVLCQCQNTQSAMLQALFDLQTRLKITLLQCFGFDTRTRTWNQGHLDVMKFCVNGTRGHLDAQL